MRRVFGPRTFVEAAFLIAVPIGAAALGQHKWTIIAASAVGYLLVLIVEASLAKVSPAAAGRPGLRLPVRPPGFRRPQPKPDRPTEPDRPARPDGPAPAVPVAPRETAPALSFAAPGSADHVRILRPETEPASEPDATPEPEPEPEPAPEPVSAALTLAPELAAEPVHERPQLAAVPEPVVAAEPEAEPEPEPAAPTVVPIGYGAGPRQWNLWELERLTREHTGGDSEQAEERQFLLMYLREFADSDGQLPLDFDGLVRDSFGELVGTR